MRGLILALAVLAAGCAPGISGTTLVRPLLGPTTVGGAGYPVVVTGAERVGMNEETVAAGLRFPASVPGDFRAVPPGAVPPTNARLTLAPASGGARATLAFLHGERRIGVGWFILPETAYRGEALGKASATLIAEMLREARQQRDEDRIFEED